MQMQSRDDLIKHSDTHYTLGKYDIRYERQEFDGVFMWVATYKDFFGDEAIANTLDECIQEILDNEAYDWGEPDWTVKSVIYIQKHPSVKNATAVVMTGC